MGYTALNIGVLMNNVLEMIWKKPILGCFRLGKENHKKFNTVRKIMTNFIIGLRIQNAALEPQFTYQERMCDVLACTDGTMRNIDY
jgi:hypothetical protein